jgi:hypothetical protein
MHEISKQLSALPDTLSDDPQRKLIALCGEFTHVLSQFVDGSGNRPDYFVQMKPHFKVLKSQIEGTKPVLHVDGNTLNVPGENPYLGRVLF